MCVARKAESIIAASVCRSANEFSISTHVRASVPLLAFATIHVSDIIILIVRIP